MTDEENESLKNPLQHGGLTDQVVALSPPAGLNQEEWNLVKAYHWHLWSDEQGNQEDNDRFLAAAFQEHPSIEDPSDAAQPQQLSQYTAKPSTRDAITSSHGGHEP